jgi:TonB family protein
VPGLLCHLSRWIAFFICCFSIAFVLSNSPVLAQDTANWDKYNPQNEDFSVLLPEPPLSIWFSRPRLKDRPSEFGRMYSAYNNGSVFIILSLDNPKGQDSLEAFIDEYRKNEYPVVGGNETLDKEVQVNGFKGKQYIVQTERLRSITQFYVTKERAYIFEVISERWNDESVNRFFTSIKLDKRGKAQGRLSGNQTTPTTPTVSEAESVFTTKDVTRKAFMVARPVPMYTEEARQNAVEGTVVLRCVFSSRGLVTNIRVVKGLPDGLTEKAIMAARNIRFFPAMKDGKYVAQYIQIEYNFNLY